MYWFLGGKNKAIGPLHFHNNLQNFRKKSNLVLRKHAPVNRHTMAGNESGLTIFFALRQITHIGPAFFKVYNLRLYRRQIKTITTPFPQILIYGKRVRASKWMSLNYPKKNPVKLYFFPHIVQNPYPCPIFWHVNSHFFHARFKLSIPIYLTAAEESLSVELSDPFPSNYYTCMLLSKNVIPNKTPTWT